MNLTLKTGPTTEPVTATEAKAHLRVDYADDDTYITTLIKVARQHAEDYTQRSFITQTWELRLDEFPNQIDLLRPPAIAVSSIAYVDTDGNPQTLASTEYTVDIYSIPGRVVEAYSKSWPSTREQPNAVTVTYTAGYGAASAVPEAIKQAILILVAHWYEQREAVSPSSIVDAPLAYKALLAPYQVIRFA